MADQWDRQSPPRLVGYESWLYQMPCIDGSGDLFVSVALAGHTDRLSEFSTRWLVAVGDVSGKGEPASRLKEELEAEVNRLVGKTGDPASILMALNNDLFDPNRFACLMVAVIDSDCHELTLASAAHVAPFLRRVDRRVEALGEKATGMPLRIVPEPTYENVTVSIGPGEVVIFHSDGLTAVVDHQSHLLDLNSLRLAIAEALDGAASVGQSILEAIRLFGQGRPQVDDITLLCVGRPVPQVSHKRTG
jgi:sigma-B regulation protein RsbU (phosphoserine phosphatase)